MTIDLPHVLYNPDDKGCGPEANKDDTESIRKNEESIRKMRERIKRKEQVREVSFAELLQDKK